MNLSRNKLILFFLVLGLFVWFLYPRELFLAYIYEGGQDLRESESHYLEYLAKKPKNKFATLRLAILYERKGTPEKAIPLLTDLYEYRPGDFSIATSWLNLLEDMQDDSALQDARLKIIDDYWNRERFNRKKLLPIIEDAFNYSLFINDEKKADLLLNKYLLSSAGGQNYEEYEIQFDRGHKNTEDLVAIFKRKIDQKKLDVDSVSELVRIYMLEKKYDEAYKLVNRGILATKGDVQLIKLKIDLLHISRQDDNALEKEIRLLLSSGILTSLETNYYTELLAAQLSKAGKTDEAFQLYSKLIEADPKNRKMYFNAYYFLADHKLWDKAVTILEDITKKFPEDERAKGYLFDALLYNLKRIDIPFFEKTVKELHSITKAIDVANYLLFEEKDTRSSIEWIRKMLAIFPGDSKLSQLLLDCYIRDKNWNMALKVIGSMFDRHVAQNASGDLYLKKAQIELEMGLYKEALHTYLEWKNQYYESAFQKTGGWALIKEWGKFLYYVGDLSDSRILLEKYVSKKGNDVEALYLLMEINGLQSNSKKAESLAIKLKDILSKENEKTSKDAFKKRVFLKASVRLDRKNARWKQAYENLIRSYPKDFDLRADYFEWVVFSKNVELAKNIQKSISHDFPSEKRRNAELLVSLQSLQKQWKEAEANLRQLDSDYGSNPFLDTSLSEALVAQGKWKEGIKRLEGLMDFIPDWPGLQKRYRELRDRFDHRAGLKFSLSNLGTDDVWGVEGFTQYWLGEKWKIKTVARAEHATSSVTGTSDTIFSGGAGFEWLIKPSLSVSAYGNYGISDAKKVFSPEFKIQFAPRPELTVGAGYQYGMLRRDFARALLLGSTWDKAFLDYRFSYRERFSLSGQYTLAQNHLAAGLSAWEQSITQTAQYLLFKKPQVLLGYSFNWSDVYNDNGFVALVPLITAAETHYVTLDVSRQWKNGFELQLGGRLGGDRKRNLSFIKGDLWGVYAGGDYPLTRYLDLNARYEFAKESQITQSGSSHQFDFGFSGHWH